MRRILLLLLFSATLPAASLSQSQLDRMVAYWQHVLRLDDWTVYASAVPLEKLPDGTSGASRSESTMKVCHLLVLRPEDYVKLAKREEREPMQGRAVFRDIEDTVVHELVHLRIKELMYADPDHLQTVEEATVVRLTDALLKARKR